VAVALLLAPLALAKDVFPDVLHIRRKYSKNKMTIKRNICGVAGHVGVDCGKPSLLPAKEKLLLAFLHPRKKDQTTRAKKKQFWGCLSCWCEVAYGHLKQNYGVVQ